MRSKQGKLWGLISCAVLAFLLLTLFIEELPEEEEEELHTSSYPGYSDLLVRSIPRARSAAKDHAIGPPLPMGKPAQNVPYPMRVFIYDDVAPALNRNLQGREECLAPYRAAEMILPELFARTTMYTTQGELADFYVVPVFTECFLLTRLNKGIDFARAAAALNKAFQTTLDDIQSKFPFWSRTEGRDHIFVFPTERGPAILTDANLQRIRKAVFVVGSVSRSNSRFDTHKDVVVPPARGPWTPTADALPLRLSDDDDRRTLLHFRGVLPGQGDLNPWGVRSTLAKVFAAPMDGVVFQESTAECGRACTRREMLDSRYCLVPDGGVEGWSLRMYDSLVLGCVPVLIADDSELAFEGRVDYSTFSVKILEDRVNDTITIVRHLGDRKYTSKIEALEARKAPFIWHAHWQEGDAFDMMLQELYSKLRFMRNSPYRFWVKPLPTG